MTLVEQSYGIFGGKRRSGDQAPLQSDSPKCRSSNGAQGHIFVGVEVVSLEIDSDSEIGKSARPGNADDLPTELFDIFSFLAAEKGVICIVGLRGDDVDVQPLGAAANRCLGAADKNRFYGEALIFKEAFSYGDAKRQLVVPGKADEDDTQGFFLLARGQTGRQKGKDQDQNNRNVLGNIELAHEVLTVT